VARAFPEFAIELPRKAESASWNAKLKELLNNKVTPNETVYKLLEQMAEANAFDGETFELQHKFVQSNLQAAVVADKAAAQATPNPIVLPHTKSANEMLQGVLDYHPTNEKIRDQFERQKRHGAALPGSEREKFYVDLIAKGVKSRVDLAKQVEDLMISSKIPADPETLLLIHRIFVKEGKVEEALAHVRGLVDKGLIDQVGYDIFVDRQKRASEKQQ